MSIFHRKQINGTLARACTRGLFLVLFLLTTVSRGWAADSIKYSTDTEKYYYVFKNSADNTYHIVPSGTTSGSAVKTEKEGSFDENMDVWYFEKITGFSGYRIVHALTGLCLYTNGNSSNTSDPVTNAYSLKGVSELTDDDAFRARYSLTSHSYLGDAYFIYLSYTGTYGGGNGYLNRYANPVEGNGNNLGLGQADNASGWYIVEHKCEKPTIKLTVTKANGNEVTVSSSDAGATYYYTTAGTPTTSSTKYTGTITGLKDQNLRVIAVKDYYSNSDVATMNVAAAPAFVSSLDEIFSDVSSDANLKLDRDIIVSGDNETYDVKFAGTLDGDYHTISGLKKPLFKSLNGGTVKNLILDNVQITSTEANVGAIACQAIGGSRIYNCGVLSKTGTSTVTGTGYVGGLVGWLTGSSRVINCYSYANVAGGTWGAGIVGYNNTASTNSNVQTMIVNCMFYGDITAGTKVAPIYGGNKITNSDSTGLNNYNYYRYAGLVSKSVTDYNCALAMEDKYIQRHEYYRGILNSNRELCAWYVTDDVADTAEIGKWVLDTEIAPYPIIKKWGTYPSMVNRFITEAPTATGERQGKLLTNEGTNGFLTVTINRGSNGSGDASKTIQLPITDMNEDTYDYNYAKVVLPFYNDYFGGNYTDKVVTGWKVTSVTGGTAGTYSTSGTDALNFADRKCTAKDLYATSGRVFAQGGYYHVPEGVTAITIEAYWGNAIYMSDEYYDETIYEGGGSGYVGQRPTTYNGQTVYNSLDDAVKALPSSDNVYDYAIVLVGNTNYVQTNYYQTLGSSSKGCTIMSVDADNDHEPDYCLMTGTADRNDFMPLRLDFLWAPGVGRAHKQDGVAYSLEPGIWRPLGWFEITETALIRFTEMEYDKGEHGSKSSAPLILLNGIIEQMTSTHAQVTPTQYTTNIVVGGNVYIKSFSPGSHPDRTSSTKHCPVSVLGGEYKEFHLSGMYQPGAQVYADGNVMCYINGGKFGTLASGGKEQLNADIWFKIDNALIDEFYGGGENEQKPVLGNINTVISNSHVTKFCGGPKFGAMSLGKTVTTTATNCVFGTFYGAGNGGTSLYNEMKASANNLTSGSDFSSWYSNYKRGSYDSSKGIATSYDYEFFAWAGSTNEQKVGRFYVNYASLSLTTVPSVSSTLTNCTVENDFYGAGNLGLVSGNATSILDGCTIKGNVFGAGFSAAIPTVDVMPQSNFVTVPDYNSNVGIYTDAVFPTSVAYTWSNTGSTSSPFTDSGDNHYIYTKEDLTNLGSVYGNTEVTVKGASQVDGAVFGGGNESSIYGNTVVNIETDGTKVINAVYGGANKARVGGGSDGSSKNTTTVNIKSGKVTSVYGANNQKGDEYNAVYVNVTGGEVGTIFGGGNQAEYGSKRNASSENFPQVTVSAGTVGTIFGGGNQADVTGNTVVKVTGGTVTGNVYGGGNNADVTGQTNVTIGGN